MGSLRTGLAGSIHFSLCIHYILCIIYTNLELEIDREGKGQPINKYHNDCIYLLNKGEKK